MNSKYKHIPNTESLPEPDFEMTISDFPKLQSLGNNDLLDLQKCTCWPLASAEEDILSLKSTVRPKTSALITKEVSCLMQNYTEICQYAAFEEV